MLTCYLDCSRPVPEWLTKLLYKLAQDMVKKHKSRMKFKNTSCQGLLTTKWHSGALGTIAGTEFKVEYCDAEGDSTATFIVRSFDEDVDLMPSIGFGSHAEAEQFDAAGEAYLRRKANKRLN